MAQDLLLLSDGTSHLLLSDGVSRLLLSTSSVGVDPNPVLLAFSESASIVFAEVSALSFRESTSLKYKGS